jgi:hypothetical protein
MLEVMHSSLIYALIFISLALSANFKVERDSWKLAGTDETVAMIVVLEFPPSESRSRKVSLLSRYRM